MMNEKKKILFVDDEASLLKLLKLNVEAAGPYEVRVESSGVRAVETALDFKPNIIFLDLIMPDIEGSEVADRIRAESALNKIPIIFMTAMVSAEEIRQNNGRIGNEEFIAKPAKVGEIVARIQDHLGR